MWEATNTRTQEKAADQDSPMRNSHFGRQSMRRSMLGATPNVRLKARENEEAS
jgi:hypothetical protein